jgi:hypothetical protein
MPLRAIMVCAALIAVGQVAAKPPAAPASTPSAPVMQSPASAPRLVEKGRYVNRDGVLVHSPSHTDTGVPPAGASAQCADGGFSFSQHRRGTCSHHGGVIRWI